MGILSYTNPTAPVKNAYRSSSSYAWSTFVSIGANVRIKTTRFVHFRKAPAGPVIEYVVGPPEALNSGGVPGVENESVDSTKNIGNKGKEMDTEISKISVSAVDTKNEDSLTQKICDPGTVEKNIDDSDETQRLGIWGCVSLAAAKVDGLVRVDAMGKLKNYLQDEQVRAFVKTVKDASSKVIRKKVKSVPGGLKAYDMILRSLYKLGDSLQRHDQSQSHGNETEDLKRDIMEIILNAVIFLLLIIFPTLLSATRDINSGIYYSLKQKLLDLNKKIYNSVKSAVNYFDVAVREFTDSYSQGEKVRSDFTSFPESPILTIILTFILELIRSVSGGETAHNTIPKSQHKNFQHQSKSAKFGAGFAKIAGDREMKSLGDWAMLLDLDIWSWLLSQYVL